MSNISESDLKLLKSKGYYKGSDSVKSTKHLEEFIRDLKDPNSEMLVLPPMSAVINKAKGGMVDKKSKPTKKTKKAGRLAMRGYGIARK